MSSFLGLVRESITKAESKPTTTAPTTPAEQTASAQGAANAQASATSTDNSVFENKASSTVIISDDYKNKNTNSIQDNNKIWIRSNMQDMLEAGYGWSAANGGMSEGEKNSAMAAIVDNNRWMIDNINHTYVFAQASDALGSSEVLQSYLESDISEKDKNAVLEAVADVASTFGVDGSTATEEDVADMLADVPEDIRNAVLENFKSEQKAFAEGKKYDQFDKNVRTDQIPPEFIEATDFSSHVFPDGTEEAQNHVFIPDLNTLTKDGSGTVEDLSSTFTFEADNSIMSLTPDALAAAGVDINDPEATKTYIQNEIAKNYLTEDQLAIMDSNGDGNYDLTSSMQGMNILSALMKEEGNNEMFAGMNEDLSGALDIMYEQLKAGELNLYCPDTEINLMTESGEAAQLDDTAAYQLLLQEGSDGVISYIHANEDSIPLNHIDHLTGLGILENFSYGDGTLADLVPFDENGNYIGDTDNLALVESAIKQVASNNPGMLELVEEHLADPSKGGILSLLTEVDFKEGLWSAGQQELVLENIQYIIEDSPEVQTPKAKTIPEDPPAEENNPTVPDPTEPDPTTPDPTTPEPTDPCPSNPDIDKPGGEIGDGEDARGEGDEGNEGDTGLPDCGDPNDQDKGDGEIGDGEDARGDKDDSDGEGDGDGTDGDGTEGDGTEGGGTEGDGTEGGCGDPNDQDNPGGEIGDGEDARGDGTEGGNGNGEDGDGTEGGTGTEGDGTSDGETGGDSGTSGDSGDSSDGGETGGDGSSSGGSSGEGGSSAADDGGSFASGDSGSSGSSGDGAGSAGAGSAGAGSSGAGSSGSSGSSGGSGSSGSSGSSGDSGSGGSETGGGGSQGDSGSSGSSSGDSGGSGSEGDSSGDGEGSES